MNQCIAYHEVGQLGGKLYDREVCKRDDQTSTERGESGDVEAREVLGEPLMVKRPHWVR